MGHERGLFKPIGYWLSLDPGETKGHPPPTSPREKPGVLVCPRGGEHQRACGQLTTQVIPWVVNGIYHQPLTHVSNTTPPQAAPRCPRTETSLQSVLADPQRVGKKLSLTVNVQNVEISHGAGKGPVFSYSLEKSESLATLRPHSGK